MRLESPIHEVNKPQEEVYAAVNDVQRYREFMPSAVGSFDAGEDFGIPWFSFTIGGMPEIKLVRSAATPYTRVGFSTPMGAKIALEVLITPLSPEKCTLQIAIEADVNPMLRMMVERPLRKFLNEVSEKICAAR